MSCVFSLGPTCQWYFNTVDNPRSLLQALSQHCSPLISLHFTGFSSHLHSLKCSLWFYPCLSSLVILHTLLGDLTDFPKSYTLDFAAGNFLRTWLPVAKVSSSTPYHYIHGPFQLGCSLINNSSPTSTSIYCNSSPTQLRSSLPHTHIQPPHLPGLFQTFAHAIASSGNALLTPSSSFSA